MAVIRPLLHPIPVNGRTGDPALYIETLFERRAIPFDLGDIAALSPRKVQRLEHVFVSHILFIEAAFATADTALVAERAHLTTAAAGNIARAGNVRASSRSISRRATAARTRR